MAKETSSLLRPVIFVQLLTSGLVVCLSGFALMTSGAGDDGAKFIAFLGTMFLQLIVWCWPGELLIQDSGAVGDVLYYELPWYELTSNRQRDLSFAVLRTQRECQITALGFQVMSLRKLTEVRVYWIQSYSINTTSVWQMKYFEFLKLDTHCINLSMNSAKYLERNIE